MVLRFCRRHERRWSFIRQCWLPFPEASVQAIQAYAARLRLPQLEAFHVVETDCDGCAATLWQLAQRRRTTHGLPRGEV